MDSILGEGVNDRQSPETSAGAVGLVLYVQRGRGVHRSSVPSLQHCKGALELCVHLVRPPMGDAASCVGTLGMLVWLSL
uniref:Uncharacterized protein n=1 Tax=Fagus sylvatica TaxID=28930 RepID=A0A2N9FN14_FAGSY